MDPDAPPNDDDEKKLMADEVIADDGGKQIQHQPIKEEEEEHAIVQCTTTAGPITMHMHRAWAPNGYDRAVALFERSYYDQSHFFRVVPHFLVQFGISYTSDVELKHFADSTIADDPKRSDILPFKEGMMSFAGSGPNSRSSQLFIAYDRAGGLGTSPWETPFGEVVQGIENVRNFFSEYGDMPPWGKGPQQGPIRNQGSKYIEENFPMLDKFEICTVKRVASLTQQNDIIEEVKEMKEVYRGTMRGVHDLSSVKERVLKVTKTQQQQKEIEEKKKSTSPIFAKVTLIIILVVVILQVFARRKKSKREGKSV